MGWDESNFVGKDRFVMRYSGSRSIRLLSILGVAASGVFLLLSCSRNVPSPFPGNHPAKSFTVLTIPIPNLSPDAIPMDMVCIPAGQFMMGSAASDPDRHSTESPQHPVTLTHAFYLGKYEVTQAQWMALMESNPSYFQGNGNQPVETVSWEDCLRFIAKLNVLGQGTFRLPTEAEWEYACRAGTAGRFYWGPDPGTRKIAENAWYEGNQSQAGPQEVGTRLPNPWGLYDMAGNVAEWCRDWYGPYPAAAQTDPTGPMSGTQHVKRGGHWQSPAGQCRSAYRFSPAGRFGCLGFRLARDM